MSRLSCPVLLLLGISIALAQSQGGIPRGGVLELNEKNFVKSIQATPITIVSFFSGNPAEANYEGYLMQQLEVGVGQA